MNGTQVVGIRGAKFNLATNLRKITKEKTAMGPSPARGGKSPDKRWGRQREILQELLSLDLDTITRE
jgi:hypothetical protein